MNNIPKARYCKVCETRFKPETIFQWWCCENHKADYAVLLVGRQREQRAKAQRRKREEAQKAERKELRSRKQALKPNHSGRLRLRLYSTAMCVSGTPVCHVSVAAQPQHRSLVERWTVGITGRVVALHIWPSIFTTQQRNVSGVIVTRQAHRKHLSRV